MAGAGAVGWSACRRALAGLAVALALLDGGSVAAQGTDIDPAAAARIAARGIYRRPATIPVPSDDPPTEARIALGRRLFFEVRLSATGTIACATCHSPDHGWGSPPERPRGADGSRSARKAPALLDLAWAETLMWDGREPDLERQALEPLTDPATMGTAETLARSLGVLAADPAYAAAFAAVFPGGGVTADTVARAIASFERTLVSPRTGFDDWVDGDEDAIPPAAKRGFAIFTDLRTRCVDCHAGWRFTDGTFRDTGLPSADRGRGALRPGVAVLQHAFKTPGLRQLAWRAPYMHDGSLPDLDAVIDHYAAPPVARPSLPEYIRGFALAPAERADLKAFLATLSTPPGR